MLIYAVDLGSTNTKVVLYDDQLGTLAAAHAPMEYVRSGPRVEFDPEALFTSVVALMHECAGRAGIDGAGRHARIVVTGQAESLVLVDADGAVVAPGMSWMDERSVDEARQMAEHFDPATSFAITGEPEPVATWPATKLRWLAMNRPDVLAAGHRALMIKDYILLRFTGLAVGEETTRGFTYLYDVREKEYWTEMVEYCGVRPDALPEIVPAGIDLGPALARVAERLPRAASYTVNTGALDHFCAMVGTDCYRAGSVSASAGTVLSVSMLTTDWQFDPAVKASFHSGLRTGETVLFTCADSGGVCLNWFRENVATDLPYKILDDRLTGRCHDDAPLFLPYLTGVNPPDFVDQARGAFLNLQLRHDRFDLAFAVMEGVAHLLRRNLDYLAAHGHPAHGIVSAGGGAASGLWNQLKADVCGLELRTPQEPEASCRGAAALALVAAGAVDSLDEAAALHRPDELTFRPHDGATRLARYRAFDGALRHLYGTDPDPGPLLPAHGKARQC